MQVRAQNKDFGAVLQMDLAESLFPSVAQATNTTGIFLSVISIAYYIMYIMFIKLTTHK